MTKIVNLSEHLSVLETTVHSVEPLDFRDELSFRKSDNILRIEEKVQVTWTGVKGCSRHVDRNVKKALEKWVKQKMFEHKDLRWVQYGSKKSSFKCSRSKDPWTSVRKCGCLGKVPFFIDFQKP